MGSHISANISVDTSVDISVDISVDMFVHMFVHMAMHISIHTTRGRRVSSLQTCLYTTSCMNPLGRRLAVAV